MVDKKRPNANIPAKQVMSEEINAAPLIPDIYENIVMPQMNNVPDDFTKYPCPCIPQEMMITNVKLATAYVPFQKYCGTFCPIEGLDKGTVFPELYSPYKGENKSARPPKYV